MDEIALVVDTELEMNMQLSLVTDIHKFILYNKLKENEYFPVGNNQMGDQILILKLEIRNSYRLRSFSTWEVPLWKLYLPGENKKKRISLAKQIFQNKKNVSSIVMYKY